MDDFNYKRIQDPLYGSIGFSKLETRIIDTPVFQRLRNVKHLGLAHYVFPGADFPRFSHSLGACHLMGRMLEALRSGGYQVEQREVQELRLAALLHDIGHYPFSHLMEDAIRNYYTGRYTTESERQNLNSADGNGTEEVNDEHTGRAETADPEEDGDGNIGLAPDPTLMRPLLHESVSKEILLEDKSVNTILKSCGFDPERITSIFMREGYGTQDGLMNLISSDLDVDRLDYLMRTAYHARLPYGSVDLDYILTQVQRGDDNRICFPLKALRAIDHLLLSRYFDRLQVAYHKTVVAFELLLKDVIMQLLREGFLDCSGMEVSRKIREGEWSDFDDAFVLKKIREYTAAGNENGTKTKARCILERRPPRLIWSEERLVEREDDSYWRSVRLLERVCNEGANLFGIDRTLILIWSANVVLTKLGPDVPAGRAFYPSEDDVDRWDQMVRVVVGDGGPNSKVSPVVDVDCSLMRILGRYRYCALRVYVVRSDDIANKLEELSKFIRREMNGAEMAIVE